MANLMQKGTRKRSNHFWKFRWERNLNSNERKVIIILWLKIQQILIKSSQIELGSWIKSFKKNWMMNLPILKWLWLRARSRGQRNWRSSWLLSVGLLLIMLSKNFHITKSCNKQLDQVQCLNQTWDHFVVSFWRKLDWYSQWLNKKNMIKLLMHFWYHQIKLKNLKTN